MQKTSDVSFKKYGNTYTKPQIFNQSTVSRFLHITTRTLSTMYCHSHEICIEIQSGHAIIAVLEDIKHYCSNEIEIFSISKFLKIKPGICFNIIPLTREVTCKIIEPIGYSIEMKSLMPPFTYKRISTIIRIPEILGLYSETKWPSYKFQGEKHDFFELTYVDHGHLDTTVDGKTYTLNKFELMFYGKNQYHSQQVTKSVSCSYTTILFEMDFEGESKLLNKVFKIDSHLHQLLRNLIRESKSSSPFSESLMICHLQEIVLSVLQQEHLSNKPNNLQIVKPTAFQNDLVEQITTYIEESIYQPLTVENISQKFNLSRSTIQTLFRSNLSILPKAYILDKKLKKSKQLIREDKYTISEISAMLGFKNIHYFSRLFKQTYQIPPSEYAKKIYRD